MASLLLLTSTVILAQNSTITYCIDPNWLPYEALEKNQHIGMSSDYLKLLSVNTDYQFQLIMTADWETSLNHIKTGQCKLLLMLNQTPERDEYLDFSEEFFKSPNFLVARDNHPFLHNVDNIGQRSLGVTQGYRIEEYINTNYPELNTVAFVTEAKGLQALSDGDIDLFIGSVHSVNNQIQALELTNLKLVGWGGPDDSLRMGVAKGHQTLLRDINEVLANITKQQHFEIYNRWNNVTVIDNTNYSLIWQISLGGLLLLIILLVRYLTIRSYNTKLTLKNAQLSELQNTLTKTNKDLRTTSQRDALTKLYNRHYFNQLVEHNTINQSTEGPVSLIFMDLDHFKQINDVYGHVVGDTVLEEFGHVLIASCRAGELVGRWGGEEFIILKKHSEIQDAEALCQQIQKNIKTKSFSHKKSLTCSFGIAQMRSDETLLACFERADQMLYDAKHQGRDRICIAN